MKLSALIIGSVLASYNLTRLNHVFSASNASSVWANGEDCCVSQRWRYLVPGPYQGHRARCWYHSTRGDQATDVSFLQNRNSYMYYLVACEREVKYYKYSQRENEILIAITYNSHQFPVNCKSFISHFKDARSVSSYPYNQPQILQNVKYTK